MWMSRTSWCNRLLPSFMLLFDHCVMMSSYVTTVYMNCWSWQVHGSHSVCLLKPGVTTPRLENRRIKFHFDSYIFSHLTRLFSYFVKIYGNCTNIGEGLSHLFLCRVKPVFEKFIISQICISALAKTSYL
jgi:hypothetical protein